MPSIKFDTIVETAKVVSGFRDIQNAVHQTAERVEKDGKSIDDVISNIQNSMNIAIGGWSIGKFVNQMMQVRGQFQQTEMAFKTMLQSEEKADALMKQLIRTAAVTPFGVEDVTEGAKQLLAFNVAAEDVNKTLIGLGDVAAGMGLNLKDLVMLYGTTIAKGKMDTMDLYQFLNRGIPIADEIAKVMGLDVTNAIKEVQKQIKAGKVTSDIFIQAMQSMTAEGSKFGGLMEAQSKTITGQISNIEDAIEQMFNDLGKSQEGVINTGLGVVSTLVENWETVGKVLMTVVAAYGAYKAAVITMIAISKAQVAWESAKAFLSLAKSITTAKDAMALFNLVSSSNVLGLVLGAVAAGVTMFNLFGNSAEDAATKTSKFTESANEASSKVESLVSILKTAKEGSKVYKDTIKELSNIYGNYGIAIDKIKEDESNLVDVKQQEIDKSKELVEQIKLEATERNRANAISKANEDYNNRVDSAQQALLGKLKDYGTSSSGIAVGIQNIVSDSVIKQFDDLTQKMAGLNEHSKEYQTYLKQYNQLEASLISDSSSKTSKYEHILPQLAAVEDDEGIDGLMVLLNTVGGDVEAGLAIAEMIASLSKPKVCLVLGGGHSIGVPLAVSGDVTFIVPSATMVVHPIRMNGTVLGVTQNYEYIERMQDRIIEFTSNHCSIKEEELREIMFNTKELTKDIGSVLVGRQAVEVGIIDRVGGIHTAMNCLYDLINAKKNSKIEQYEHLN